MVFIVSLGVGAKHKQYCSMCLLCFPVGLKHTSGIPVYTSAVTNSFLNASYNVYIAFCPRSGNKKLDKLDDSKNFQFQKGV